MDNPQTFSLGKTEQKLSSLGEALDDIVMIVAYRTEHYINNSIYLIIFFNIIDFKSLHMYIILREKRINFAFSI